jgi:hypothetical protein
MRYSAVVNYAGAVEIPLLPRHPASFSSSALIAASQSTPATFADGFSAPRVLTDKTRIQLRSASVRTYTFFTTGFPRFLSIRGARGLLALNQVLI